MIIGGGGARNTTLVERLAQELAGVPVSTHEAHGIPSEAKEAMAFALLAYLTLTGRPGNVPKATGAKKPVVLGAVAPGVRAVPGRRASRLARRAVGSGTVPEEARLLGKGFRGKALKTIKQVGKAQQDHGKDL